MMPAYWHEYEFRMAWTCHRSNPSPETERVLCEWFEKLADGFWKRYAYRFRRLDRDAAVADCVALCWQKHTHWTPDKGSGFSYFTKIIQYELQAQSKKETLHQERYMPLSIIDAGKEYRD